MRFKIKDNKYCPIGTERNITKFLWIPKIIKNEIRWLETTTYIQVRTWGKFKRVIWKTINWLN